MKHRIRVRRYRPGDEKGINDLFGREFAAERDLAVWNWKYMLNPAGKATMWVIEHEGSIIGHLAVNRASVQFGARRAAAAQAVDIMVDRRYRKGIAGGRMAADLASEKNHKTLRQEGLEFLFGYPVEKFLRLTKKVLKYTEVCHIRQLVKPLRFQSIVSRRTDSRLMTELAGIVDRLFGMFGRRKSRRARNSDFVLRSVARFDSRVDDLWREFVRCANPIAIARDHRYLNWRYFDHPGERYAAYQAEKDNRIAGYVVVAVRDHEGVRRGYVVDFLARPGERKTSRGLIEAAVAHCSREGAATVACWTLPHFYFLPVLRRCGFVARPSEFRLVCRDLTGGSDFEDIMTARRWYVTMGDSDGI